VIAVPVSVFDKLLPDLIFAAAWRQGFRPTGALSPLNSYENRVYEIGVEDHPPLIAKFYRPGRWTQEALGEEHRFIMALAGQELPVVEPLLLNEPAEGSPPTLGRQDDFFFAFYPRVRARQSAELDAEQRQQMGRLLARIHMAGEQFPLRHRLLLSPESYGYASLDFLFTEGFIPEHLCRPLESVLLEAVRLTEPAFNRNVRPIATHGDCHWGNILWNDKGPLLIDFDDVISAPAVQDLWMLCSGSPEEIKSQRKDVLDGYETFRAFEYESLALIEPLRTLRIIRHAAWIGQRYDEEIFKRAFPYYLDDRYWESFLLTLKEQIGLMCERAA